MWRGRIFGGTSAFAQLRHKRGNRGTVNNVSRADVNGIP